MTLAENIHGLLACRDLQEMLDTARTGLKSPLILADLTFHVLAITPDDTIEDPRWQEICAQRGLPLNIVNLELYHSALRAEKPVLSTDSTGLPIVRCAVAQEGRLIGYLLSPGYGGVPTGEELDLIRVLGDLCALKMQKELHYAEYPENMLEFFISDLLGGVITEEQTILDRCKFFHWDLKTPYRVMTIRPDRNADALEGGDYLELSRYRDALAERFPDATAFLYGTQIKLMIHVWDQTTRDTIILEEVAGFLKENGLAAGVSQTANRLGHISARHQQAMKALEMGTLLDGAGPLYYYDSYAVYHCLELCASQINILQLCHRAVLMLESYDRKNGTELLSTLHAYLSCHRNLSEAAESLFVHRNTMSKRLAKINDLIHVDFQDAETVFHLMFSYRVLEYYGATVMRDSYANWMERSPELRHP